MDLGMLPLAHELTLARVAAQPAKAANSGTKSDYRRGTRMPPKGPPPRLFPPAPARHQDRADNANR
jgi:hypothetical protein